MFYFRKEELRQFVGFLNDFRKGRPFVFYVLALGIALGLGLALSVLLFPSTAAAIAAFFSVTALANSPLYLAAVVLDQMFWNAAIAAIVGNWIGHGDTWQSLCAFFSNLKQEQPILYRGYLTTICLSLACTAISLFVPLAAPAYMAFAMLLPAIIEILGLGTTLFVKSTIDAIQDGIFSDTQDSHLAAKQRQFSSPQATNYSYQAQPGTDVYPAPVNLYPRQGGVVVAFNGQAAENSSYSAPIDLSYRLAGFTN